MFTRPAPTKIRPDHLDRQAFIYVRQSTLFQVRENTASTARQYDLNERARDLGWSPERISVIDQDQGHSGASTVGRDGFQLLIAEVGMGRAGAVFSLEVSRLARSCSDWYRLLEICALTDTLVIDEEGVYDPGLYNDRLLLGFKRPAAYSTSCSTCDCPSCRLEAALLDRIVAARMIMAHACPHRGVGAALRRPLSRLRVHKTIISLTR